MASTTVRTVTTLPHAVVTNRRFRRAAAVVGAFLLWELAARWADSPLMPGLGLTVERLIEDVRSGLMWRHAQFTLIRGFSGFAIALAGGIALGTVMARSRVVEGVLEPFLAATYPVPKIALYPIFILWLGLGAASKIALVALECIYPIAYNTYAGVNAVDRSHVWAARNAGVGRIRITFSVMLKSALPSIMAGVRIALPIMLVVMVVVETIGESVGLGFLIRFASAQFEPQGALAVVLVLAFIGFVFDRLVVLLTRVLAFWARGVQL